MSTIHRFEVSGAGLRRGDPRSAGLTPQQQDRFFALTSELFAVVDTDNRFVAINRAWETTLGWRLDELKGLSSYDLIHPDEQDAARRIGKETGLYQGEGVRFTSRLRAKNGQYHWLEWNADYSPEDGLIYASARDITSRRAMEDLIRTTEERHRRILENLPNAIVAIIDEDMQCQYLAGGEQAIGSFDRETVVGRKVPDIIGAWIPEPSLEEDIRLGLQGQTCRKVIYSANTAAYYDRTIAPMPDANGQITSVLSLHLNVTDQIASRRQVALMAQVLDESGEAILSLDLAGYITSANRRACDLYGYSLQEMIGMDARKLNPETSQSQDDEILATMGGGSHWRGEVQNRRRDGEPFWAAVTMSGLKGPTGDLEGIALIALDITKRKDTERQLAAASSNFRQIVEHSPIGIAMVDLNGRWLQVNHSSCEMLGYSEAELLTMETSDIVHPEDNSLVRSIRSGNAPELGEMSEKRLIRKDGSIVWAMVVGSRVHGADGQPRHYVCQMVDISDRKRVETRLRIEADMDPLTDTLNRRGFSEVLTNAISDAAPTGQLSLLFIDLDNFKGVNDTFGHPVGDQLLRSVAKVLKENVRSTDAVGRHGGDEFVVLLAGAADQVARSLADKLAEVIAGIGVPAGSHVVRTRASIGVAHIDARTTTTAEDALTLADRAMYAVKMRLPRHKAGRS